MKRTVIEIASDLPVSSGEAFQSGKERDPSDLDWKYSEVFFTEERQRLKPVPGKLLSYLLREMD